MKTIALKSTIVGMRDDGILHIHIRARAVVTMEDARETLMAMRLLGGGNRHPVLIDAGEYANVLPEVKKYSASKEGNIFTLADAIAYQSLAQKLVANFYIAHNKPAVPTQAFSTTDKAVEWLRTFAKTC